MGPEQLEHLLTVDAEVWTQEANLIPAFYDRFGYRLPQALREEHAALVQRLAAVS
jgi:phosphoenolpyruvate carboxykinase (GTP)